MTKEKVSIVPVKQVVGGRAKELEYSVIAINKSGEGQPSNTVMVVL